MGKVRFKVPRCGFPAGKVIDEDVLGEGVRNTLFQFGVLEKLDDNKLDDKKNVKPKLTASKSSRSKGPSSSKSKRPDSQRKSDTPDNSGD